MGYAVDRDLNLYWLSEHTAKHSDLLKLNPQSSLVIFDSTAAGGSGNAVYMTGRVRVSPEDLTDTALSRLREKAGPSSEFSDRYTKLDISGESPWRLYAFVPAAIWSLDRSHDVKGWPVVRRVELDLNILRVAVEQTGSD